jgi:hypothetical protein
LIENNFAIPSWWSSLQAALRAILNKNLAYESAEDPRTPLPLQSSLDTTPSNSNSTRSAMLVASLQLSASQTLLAIYRSQLLSAFSATSPVPYQSLHLFSCASIENGIIFGSLLSNSLQSLQRLFTPSASAATASAVSVDWSLQLSALRSVTMFGEFLSSLRRQENFLRFKEIQLFVSAMTSQLEEILQLWIHKIRSHRAAADGLEFVRESVTAVVRYGTRETCQSLQLMLHTKLREETLPSSSASSVAGKGKSQQDSEAMRREFTRGLLLCAQRSYGETLQVIATASAPLSSAPEDTAGLGAGTFLKIAEESGGSLNGLLSLSLSESQPHNHQQQEQEKDREKAREKEQKVVADWISHLALSGLPSVQDTNLLSLESFYSSQSSLLKAIHPTGMPKVSPPFSSRLPSPVSHFQQPLDPESHAPLSFSHTDFSQHQQRQGHGEGQCQGQEQGQSKEDSQRDSLALSEEPSSFSAPSSKPASMRWFGSSASSSSSGKRDPFSRQHSLPPQSQHSHSHVRR